MEQKNKLHYSKQKGQGALEYLLIIGGAVLIAAIVLVVMTTSGTAGKHTASNAQSVYNEKTEKLSELVEEEGTVMFTDTFDNPPGSIDSPDNSKWSAIDTSLDIIRQSAGNLELAYNKSGGYTNTAPALSAGVITRGIGTPFTRVANITMLETQVTVYTSSDIIIGFKKDTTTPSINIPDFVHAVRLSAAGNAQVYEKVPWTTGALPTGAATSVAIAIGKTYKIRIILKTSGAQYFIIDATSGGTFGNPIYESSGITDSPIVAAIGIANVPASSSGTVGALVQDFSVIGQQ